MKFATDRAFSDPDKAARELVELAKDVAVEATPGARFSPPLNEDELALFDLLQKDGLNKSARERVKQASKELLASIKARLNQLDRFWEKVDKNGPTQPHMTTPCWVWTGGRGHFGYGSFYVGEPGRRKMRSAHAFPAHVRF